MSAWDPIQNQIKNRQAMGSHVQRPFAKSTAPPMRNMMQRQSGSTQRPSTNNRPVTGNRMGTPTGKPATREKAKGSI